MSIYQPGSPTVKAENVSVSFKIDREGTSTIKEAALRLFRKPVPNSLFWALQDVSFTLCEGDRLGVIGRNGSGKTTLLSLLAGIYSPSKGRVFTQGRVVALLGLGVGFDTEITGRQNIFLNASLYGISGREIAGRVDDIIAFADIGEFADLPVKTYSSGMVARMGFAVASHIDADILILDEVLAVGDAQFRAKCAERMNQLRSRAKTFILVSHDASAIQEMCNRAIWLDRGKVVASGGTEEVLSAYTAKYMPKSK